jgi:hypothetical protein
MTFLAGIHNGTVGQRPKNILESGWVVINVTAIAAPYHKCVFGFANGAIEVLIKPGDTEDRRTD